MLFGGGGQQWAIESVRARVADAVREQVIESLRERTGEHLRDHVIDAVRERPARSCAA